MLNITANFIEFGSRQTTAHFILTVTPYFFNLHGYFPIFWAKWVRKMIRYPYTEELQNSRDNDYILTKIINISLSVWKNLSAHVSLYIWTWMDVIIKIISSNVPFVDLQRNVTTILTCLVYTVTSWFIEAQVVDYILY